MQRSMGSTCDAVDMICAVRRGAAAATEAEEWREQRAMAGTVAAAEDSREV